MTKAKVRRRKSRISLPGGDTAQNPLRGRGSIPREAPEAATKTARDARVRVYGIPTALAATLPLTGPLCGSQVGLCIGEIVEMGDRAGVWQVWQDISAARRNYRQRIIGTSGDPQCAAIAMVPDAMQTDQSLTVDLRTADERDISAKRAWAAWESRLRSSPYGGVIMAALDDGVTLWDGAPTATGRALVAGLVAMGQRHASP